MLTRLQEDIRAVFAAHPAGEENSVVAGLPLKIVFGVEGDRRIPLDKEFMSGLQGKAIASLFGRAGRLQERTWSADDDKGRDGRDV